MEKRRVAPGVLLPGLGKECLVPIQADEATVDADVREGEPREGARATADVQDARARGQTCVPQPAVRQGLTLFVVDRFS